MCLASCVVFYTSKNTFHSLNQSNAMGDTIASLASFWGTGGQMRDNPLQWGMVGMHVCTMPHVLEVL